MEYNRKKVVVRHSIRTEIAADRPSLSSKKRRIFMINDQSSPSHASTQTSTPRAHTVTAVKKLRLLARLTRGCLLGGIAYLLGACPTLFGAAPLGLALLAASSSYTWYILSGLLLSAIYHPTGLSGWTWAGVYILCVILRLTVRFFVDPPTLPDGRPCTGRTYLRLCWVSFTHNIGLAAQDTPPDAYTDYYPGADNFHIPSQRSTTAASDAHEAPQETERPETELHPRLFWEHPFLRILTGAVCGLTAGIFGLIMGGFHVYDLLSALTLLLLTPLATFLLISCLGETGMTLLFSPDPLGRRQALRARSVHAPKTSVSRRFHALPLCSICFLLACTVFAARQFSPTLGTPYLTVSFSTLLGLTFTLLTSSKLGALPGLTVGTVCGLAASPALSPLFILCAGSYSLLSPFSSRLGAIGGCIVGGLWCIAAEGVSAILPLLPALLIAPPAFFLAERMGDRLPFSSSKQETTDSDMRDITAILSSALSVESHARERRAKMQALADAFDSLSKRFYSLSSQLKRPRMLDLRNICDESFGKQCAHCRNRDVCWGAEYDRTLEAQARLAAQLHASGRAGVSALPDSLREFCPYMETLVGDINKRCARMTENLLRSEKTEVFAADYAAIATLLTDALEEEGRDARDFTRNRGAADAIYDYLTELGVGVQGVVVGGKLPSPSGEQAPSPGRLRIIVRCGDPSPIASRMEEVLEHFTTVCGGKFSAPTLEVEDRGSVLTFYSEASLSATYAGSTVPAGHGFSEDLPPPLTHDTPPNGYTPPAVCGDHIAMFRTDNAYFYALISDGMGTGEDASLTSDICAVFLEKMLRAGNKVDISLRMLDNYVYSKNAGTKDECSATVDLMELDLIDGQAVFAKNGASPTYVVREGKVYKLHTSSLPIGILPDTPRELLRFRTHPGDVVVMVSDGITLGNDECPWLMDLLASPLPLSMDSLRMDIIKRALTAGSEDDLSAIAIRVEER